jgi:hypothetical protein
MGTGVPSPPNHQHTALELCLNTKIASMFCSTVKKQI